ncbi:MAG: arylsulfatase [Paenibacillaceae bacterium]|nr:arylsulfatase [Paenibacillaceae bacterium]
MSKHPGGRFTLKKPNVIVFFTDQQRWDTTGIHGNPLGLTPNFDRMAQEGTHLFNAFTCQPLCGPARSCMQTGLYATTSGCFHNGIPLPTEQRTLAHYFRDAGYKTGYIGKWHLADREPVPPEQQGGYEYWLGANALENCSDAYDTVVYDNDGNEVSLPGYRVDALTDAAVRYVDQQRHNPFFLFLSFLEPHQQNHTDSYPAPVGYEEMYTGKWSPPDLAVLGGTSQQQLGGYFGMVKRLDEALGRLLDALRSRNMLDDTILLFTSDHACHFRTRPGEYKRSCHESSIRVPTALSGSVFSGGGRVKQLVSSIDLPPTLLDAAGIEVPKEMQGRSVLPLIRGEKDHWPEEMFVQISGSQVGRAIRTERWKYSVKAPDKNGKTDSCSDVYVEEYLYDLHADPYELNNLIHRKVSGGVVEDLRDRLIRRMVEAGESAPVIEPVEKNKGERVASVAEKRVKLRRQ